MIHANDARRMSEEADATIISHADRIGKRIEDEANLGKRVLILDHHHQTNDPFYIKKPPFYPPELTKFQQLVMDYVMKHGYTYKLEAYTYGVGGGLGSMDDEPKPDETGHRLVIRW